MEDQQFQFKLEHILVSDFKIIAHPEVSVDSGLASMEFGFHFSFDTKIDIAICKITINYLLATDLKDILNGTTPVMTIVVSYVYKVTDLVKFLKDIDGKTYLETAVLLNLVSVSYSTTRGIVYERSRGYGLNNHPLSVINIEDFIKEHTININQGSTSTTSFPQPS